MLITGITAYVVCANGGREYYITKREAQESSKIWSMIVGAENVSLEVGDAFGNYETVSHF